MPYDPECLRLAAHFLEDHPNPQPGNYAELAQQIQDAVEQWERRGGEDMTTGNETNFRAIVAKTAEMRKAQREYFATRDSRAMLRAKDLEREVDKMITAAEARLV